jgi:methionyl-tRNA synthetase
VPLDGWRDQPMKRLYVWFDAVIGYLSASVEWAARGPDPDAWKQWWTDPQARGYYFMGKDNIVFHSVIWPALLLGQNGAGDKGGTPGAFGTLNLPDEIVSSEFLTMSGSKFSTSRGTVIYVTGLPARVRPGRAALLHLRSPARRTRTPTSPGTSSSADELRAGQRVGQPREPVDLDGAQERRRRAEADGADGGGRGAAGDVAGGVRHRRWPARAQQVQAGDLRGDAGGDRGEPLPQRPGAVEAQGRPGPSRHDPAHRAAGGAGREHAAHAVPAARRQKVHDALGGSGVWAAQPEVREVDDLGAGPAYPVLTGDYAGEQARWSSTPVEVGRPLVKPTPIFAKLDPELGETGPEWAPISR